MRPVPRLPRHPLARWPIRAGALAAAAFAALLIHAAVLQWSGNLHAVVPGEVYRSNQPTPERLADYARDLGIRSILNLRGSNPGRDFYDAEAAAARALGIELIDFRMSASRRLTRDQVDELVALMRAAPKPMLIHCKSGADRTGLAAALYLLLVAGADEEAAEWHLTPLYGHVPVPWLSAAWPMDETWQDVERRFGIDS